jgi:3-oxosteroid 1-dehydrogenase
VRKLLLLEEFKLDISYGIGVTLCQKLRAAAGKDGVEIKMDHAVTALVVDDDRVRGVRVMTREGERIIEARKGAIFGTGGFAQNEELRSKYMSHRPVEGTAACRATRASW